MGRGAASAKTNPAASHPFPPLPHPARRDRGELETARRRDLEGMLLTKRERGEGEIPKRWEVCRGNRRRSGSAVHLCRASWRAGGRQAAPHVPGQADKQQVFATSVRR